MTRNECRDTMEKRDARITKIGQAEAKRYLQAKAATKPTGLVREALAGIVFLLAMTAAAVALLAL